MTRDIKQLAGGKKTGAPSLLVQAQELASENNRSKAREQFLKENQKALTKIIKELLKDSPD